MDNLWKKIREETSQYALTGTERARIRSYLQSHMLAHPAARVSPFMRLFVMRPIAAVLAVVIVLLGGGAGLSFASQDSLPNDFLYPVKILKEEIFMATRSSASEKVEYGIERMEKRFQEAAVLAQKDELSSELQSKIAENISTQVDSVKEAAKNIEATNPGKALETATKLHVSLETSTKALAIVDKNNATNPIMGVASTKAAELAVKKSEVTKTVTESSGEEVEKQAIAKLAKLRKEVASLASYVDLDANQTTKELLDLQTAPLVPIGASDSTPSVSPANASGASPLLKMPISVTASVSKAVVLDGGIVKPVSGVSVFGIDIASSGAEEVLEADDVTEIQKSFIAELSTLLDQADQKIAEGKFGEALVLLEQVDERIEKQKKISTLEKELKVDLPDHIIDIPETKTVSTTTDQLTAEAASLDALDSNQSASISETVIYD